MFIIQNCGRYRRRIALPKEMYTIRRRNITYWSCFYSSCNPDFSSFLFGVASATSGSSTASTPSSHYAGRYSCFWSFSAQLAKSPMQQLANHSAGLLLLYAGQNGFDWRWIGEIRTTCPSSFKMSTQQQRNNKISSWLRWSICSVSTKQPPPVLDIQCHRMDETKGFGRTGKSQPTTAIGSASR